MPQRGKHVRFLRMAEHNALVEWESGEKKRAGRDARFQVLDELRDALQLDAVPRRIEAFDISHLEGSDAVASLVVFVDGRPEKQSYRHFRLRSLDGKVDDYAAMREVVARRYTRAVNDNRALPDLVLVDGGKGQVSAASKVLRALELGSVPVAGLAKRNEQVFVPGRSTPVALPGRLARAAPAAGRPRRVAPVRQLVQPAAARHARVGVDAGGGARHWTGAQPAPAGGVRVGVRDARRAAGDDRRPRRRYTRNGRHTPCPPRATI